MKNLSQIITLFCIVILFNSFSQTVQFQDFILDGHKLKIDDITWKFQKGDGFSMTNKSSAFDVTDSAKVVNLFKKVENDNLGFHIPSTEELYKLIVGKVKIPPRKVNCPKEFSCKEIQSDQFASFPQSTWDGFLKLRFSHWHSCSNCSNASKEYKKICPDCKGTGNGFCNIKSTCPICKGSGKRNTEEITKSFSDALLQLDNEYLVFYFDSPTDFGLFDLKNSKKMRLSPVVEDFSIIIREGEKRVENEISDYKNRKSEDAKAHIAILDLINSGKIDEAKNRIAKLNWPNSFPYTKELNSKEIEVQEKADSLLIETIRSDLGNGNAENAAKNFKYLRPKHKSYYLIRREIESELYKKYANEVRQAKSEMINSFIKSNKDSLKNILFDDFVEIKVNSNSKSYKAKPYLVTINQDASIQTDFKFPINGKSDLVPERIIIEDFSVPIKTELIIELKMDCNKILVPDSMIYIKSDKNIGKKLYKSLLGKYYFGVWGTPLLSEEINQNVYYDELPKNVIQIGKSYYFKEYANDLLIDEGKDHFFEENIKVKRGTFRKIGRTVMVSALAFFGGLRAYEYLKIP
jgi:hypothetical protein